MANVGFSGEWKWKVTKKTDGLLVSYGCLLCGYMRFYEAWLYRRTKRIPKRMVKYARAFARQNAPTPPREGE